MHSTSVRGRDLKEDRKRVSGAWCRLWKGITRFKSQGVFDANGLTAGTCGWVEEGMDASTDICVITTAS